MLTHIHTSTASVSSCVSYLWQGLVIHFDKLVELMGEVGKVPLPTPEKKTHAIAEPKSEMWLISVVTWPKKDYFQERAHEPLLPNWRINRAAPLPLNVTRVRTRYKSWRNLVTVLLLLPKRCWITVRRGIPRVIGWVICRKSRRKIYAFEGESLQDASGVRQMVAR